MKEEDKRQFARYSKESLCDVVVDSEIYKGKVVNYSDGVCVMMKNVPQLVKGTLADIRILDCEIEFGAEVAWREEMGYHLKIGFKRLDNLKGNLKHYRLVDILLGLSKSRKTGVLEIITGSTVKKIFIENGLKIFAVSTNTNDRLGEYLLTQGKITLEEYTQASYLVEKKGKRLGQVLIDLGYLKPSDLIPSVQHQVEEIIMGLFNIDEGKFEFKEGPLSSDEQIKLKISTANIIYKGIKRINSFPMVNKMCPPLDAVFNLSKDPIPLFKSLTLAYADKRILSSVNGINPLKTILSLSSTSNFETLKAVIALLIIGLITIKGENEETNKLPLEVIFGKPVEASAEEMAEEENEEEAEADDTGTVDYTVEYTNVVENQKKIIETPEAAKPSVSRPQEMPVEETEEEKHEDKADAVEKENPEWTVEYTNIVENQREIEESSKEQEPPLPIPQEMPAEEIAEEKCEEAASVDTEIDEIPVESTNIVENQREIEESSKEQEPSFPTPQEMPVEKVEEEIYEDEAAEVDVSSTEETSDYKSSHERSDEIKVLSNVQEDVTDEDIENPVENVTDEIADVQPVADRARYVQSSSSIPEPIAMHSDMGAATGDERYVQVNDITSDNMTAEVVLDSVEQTADNADATEKHGFNKKWIILIFIIIICIGAVVPLVYENVKTLLSPPDVTTIEKDEALPSFRDKALEKATTITFREDALKKLLNE